MSTRAIRVLCQARKMKTISNDNFLIRVIAEITQIKTDKDVELFIEHFLFGSPENGEG